MNALEIVGLVTLIGVAAIALLYVFGFIEIVNVDEDKQ